MNAPTLLLRPARDKKAYRLKCRFKIEAYPYPDRLERAKVRMAERFVEDMHKQGWEYAEQFGFKMKGPFPMVETMILRRPRQHSAKEMLAGVLAGNPYRDEGVDYAKPVLALDMQEYWEYELCATFSRMEILTEYPDAHEEEKG